MQISARVLSKLRKECFHSFYTLVSKFKSKRWEIHRPAVKGLTQEKSPIVRQLLTLALFACTIDIAAIRLKGLKEITENMT